MSPNLIKSILWLMGEQAKHELWAAISGTVCVTIEFV